MMNTPVTVLPITSRLVAAPLLRITLQPSQRHGLQKTSQVMIDKALIVKRDKLGNAFGHVKPDTLVEVERCLAVFLGIVK
jgi:mRNA interferase MazF